MTNTLRDLGNTYEDCIIVQRRVIDSYRKKLNEARKNYNWKEVQRLNALLRVLYDEKIELERAAHDIDKYYS